MIGSLRALLTGAAAAGTMAALSLPAHAVLQIAADVSGTKFFCVDNNAACDLNPAVGTIQLNNLPINGVQVNGSIHTSTGTPANPGLDALSSSSLSIINLTDVAKVVTAAVSDTDFSAPVAAFHDAGGGVWQNASVGGSTIEMNWFDDPTNTQGADTATDTPGTLIDTFSQTATGPTDGFAHNGSGAASDLAPFSMTQQVIIHLNGNAELINRGQTEIKTALPEPASLSLLGIGLLGLGALARRRRKNS